MKVTVHRSDLRNPAAAPDPEKLTFFDLLPHVQGAAMTAIRTGGAAVYDPGDGWGTYPITIPEQKVFKRAIYAGGIVDSWEDPAHFPETRVNARVNKCNNTPLNPAGFQPKSEG